MTMRARLRSVAADDAGIGLVLVMGIILFVTALSIAATAIALNGLGQSRSRVSYEQALAVAETGINFTLGNVQKAYDDYNADFAVPSEATAAQPTPVCALDAIADDLSRPATAAEERAWAAATIAKIITDSNKSCIEHAPNGDYVIFKPSSTLVNGAPKAGRVYVQSWVPGYGVAGAKTRLVKSEYLFMPYRPSNAVLTGGNLQIDSSTTVTYAFGVDPTSASVHANGTISVQGNPTVTGPVTSTAPSTASSDKFASNPGGAVLTTPTQSLPRVSARSLYVQAASVAGLNLGDWYDLCPGGVVRPYNGAAGPCTSATQDNVSGSGGNLLPFRGWDYVATTHTWIATRDALDGIYYVDQGNIDVGTGNGTFSNMTVIAAAENPGDCITKQYGSITWDHFAISAPAYPNLWMYADSDLVTHSNFTAGHGTESAPVISGMFVAGDQIHMETSSQGAVGSVAASDQCLSPPGSNQPNPGDGLISTNEITNPAIYYDPNSDSPFTGVVDTTLWLEYPG